MADCNSKQEPLNCIVNLDNINIEDLQYIERDLSFAQKISVAFLLYGDNQANATYALQKLIVITGIRMNESVSNNLTTLQSQQTDLLRQFANTKPNWRNYLIEALCIIKARSVLRKMGFSWNVLRQHYLPHIPEIALHIHPLLKALYKVCEGMTKAQAGRLVLYINDKHITNSQDQLRFYDREYLEVFLLDWCTRQIIKLGNEHGQDTNVQTLIEYFKFNDLDALATLLIDSINSNAQASTSTDNIIEPMTALSVCQNSQNRTNDAINSDIVVKETIETQKNELIPRDKFSYIVRREQAGIALIINQEKFHQKVSIDLQSKLPKMKLSSRAGTNADKKRLEKSLSAYGYQIAAYDNLSHFEILQILRDTVQRSLLYDSLIVCILSHGIDGAVYGSNSIPVKISDIENIMTEAKTLKNKPKMLIIQACQKIESKESENKLALISVESSDDNAIGNLQPKMFQISPQCLKRDIMTHLPFDNIEMLASRIWVTQINCNAFDLRINDIEHVITRDNTNLPENQTQFLIVETSEKNGKTMLESNLPSIKSIYDMYRNLLKSMYITNGYEETPLATANAMHLRLQCDRIHINIGNSLEHAIAAGIDQNPKILILQACQKRTETNNINSNVEHNAIVNIKLNPPPETNETEQTMLDAEAYADFLKAMSTVPGYESMRQTQTGTWFIQALCDSIDKYGKSKHMLDILTTVAYYVSTKRGKQNEVMVPLTYTTLRKNFFLPEVLEHN